MSTHKNINAVCCVILALTLLLTVLLMFAKSGSVEASVAVKGYETRLFDTASVHTIDLVVSDWDGFLVNCKNEEYVQCAAVIDGESYKNIALRAKGNTSLTNVDSYGNDRYSFKIEFDHYDSGRTYHGLDKLSLNNIIQDNTYMKDYLCYEMMREFGVPAPLCSYVYITVNGEDWGLYLAVEGVEEAFLERNYGSGYGELYKPDSQSMGGGRGNGGDFKFDEWSQDNEQDVAPQMPQMPQGGGFPAGGNDFNPEMPQDGNFPDFEQGFMPNMPQFGDFPAGGNDSMPEIPQGNGFRGENFPDGGFPEVGASDRDKGGKGGFGGKESFGGKEGFAGKDDFAGKGGFGGFGGFGSSDVKLQYTDDDFDSYKNIFENAKTDITDEDKKRLIASLKSLGENENIESVVNVDEVMRYFVVHNFVCNFDSYTGTMIHNYYLYEKDGQLSMLPWDYNLAFGAFGDSSDAGTMVNYPINSPVSVGDISSRPMIAWIFNDSSYTDLYQKYFAKFISSCFDSGKFEVKFDLVASLIAPYVEKDPTKFCTYEEFLKGTETLKKFCLLRAESVRGQLEGVITSDGSAAVNGVDASSVNISDMGTMSFGKGGFGPQGSMPSGMSDNMPDAASSDIQGSVPNGMPDGIMNAAPPDMPQGGFGGRGDAPPREAKTDGKYLSLGISLAALLAGIIAAFCYKKRA